MAIALGIEQVTNLIHLFPDEIVVIIKGVETVIGNLSERGVIETRTMTMIIDLSVREQLVRANPTITKDRSVEVEIALCLHGRQTAVNLVESQRQSTLIIQGVKLWIDQVSQALRAV
jgi:hypothetical protein